MIKLSSLKIGDYFTLSDSSESLVTGVAVSSKKVYVRGSFDRSCKKYSCTKFDDCCSERFFTPSKLVCPSSDFIF